MKPMARILTSVKSNIRQAEGKVWLFDLHAFPKRDVIFNVLRGVFRARVVPRRVFVHFSVDDDVVITRRALPTADRVRVARLKIFFADRARREIVISFHDDGFVAFGES